MRYKRCRERFTLAIRLLAIGEGDVRSRLRFAYKHLRRLSPHEVPPFAKTEFRNILSSLTQRGTARGTDGTIYKTALDHTLSRMRNSTGRDIAVRIFELHAAIIGNDHGRPTPSAELRNEY